MKRGDLIYEGKAKQLYATADPELLIQFFKDDATAFNATKRGTIPSKGIYNNRISAELFQLIQKNGIPTHYVSSLTEREMLVRKLGIFPLEVVIRNTMAGSLAKRLGLLEGEPLSAPILEFYYKNDALGDPMINEDHIRVLRLGGAAHLGTIKDYAFRINHLLRGFFDTKGIVLVDLKLEFGLEKGQVVLGDEISPDTCRLWDKATGQSMDKDRFRRDLGRVEEAYQEICQRVCG